MRLVAEELFNVDAWRPALETFGAVTQLTVAIYDAGQRLVCGPLPATPLFQLFERFGSDPGLFAECARGCLTQGDTGPAIVSNRSFGLAVVGAPLLLGDRVVGAAVAGYALPQFAESTAMARLARQTGVPFGPLWEVARRQQPFPERRIRLLGELLQVLGNSLLRESHRTRELLARITAEQETTRVRKELHRKEQAARTAIEAGEEERRRISRDLHDEIGQEITALVLGLKCARDKSSTGTVGAGELERLQTMAEQMGRSMHRIAVALRPAALDALGLGGLSNYVSDWAKRHDIDADFEGPGLTAPRLPGYLEATIYRIVQEALNNISKHAMATSVNVTVQRDAREVVTIVEDDGCGFDAAAFLSRHGTTPALGILGMNERAALVGGSFTVESQPGGTTVFLRIPIPSDEALTDG